MNFIKKAFRCLFCRLKATYFNIRQDSLYRYVVCKNCKGCIRMPKNKGKMIVTCPNCGEVSEVET